MQVPLIPMVTVLLFWGESGSVPLLQSVLLSEQALALWLASALPLQGLWAFG